MRPFLGSAMLAGLLAATGVAAGAQPVSRDRMVAIPAGQHQPLYAAPGAREAVAAFRLDRDPVTRAEFAAFLRRQPRWRAAQTAPDAGSDAPRRPATGMTWHAANAYCAERGARLPTLAEWEYVAAASETRRDAHGDPAVAQQRLAMYTARTRPGPAVDRAAVNAYGVRGMHDLVWEWVADAGAHAREHEHGGAPDAWCASASIGASDPRDYPAFLRFAVRARLGPDDALGTLGFRCAL